MRSFPEPSWTVKAEAESLRKFAIALLPPGPVVALKVKLPMLKAMLLLYARRISPPKEKVWRLLSQLKPSFRTTVVSPRPCGSPVGPAKPKALPTLMNGNPDAAGAPAGMVILKAVGSSRAFGVKVRWMRLKPRRTVLVREGPKT